MSAERDWSLVKYFKREEWKNDPDRVAWDVVLLMDNMREAAQVPVVIHVAWDSGGHVSDSSHYTNTTDYAAGVDFHFVGWSLLDQWLFAERFPWNGIGVYPFWNSPGLHCDLRRLRRDHPNLGKRWWRDADGRYRAFDKEMITMLLDKS